MIHCVPACLWPKKIAFLLSKLCFSIVLIDSVLFESYHTKFPTLCESFHKIQNRFNFESTQKYVNCITKSLWLAINRFKLFWIISTFILGTFNRFKSHMIASIFIAFFLFPVLSFSCLNRFKYLVNRFMLFLDEKLHFPQLFYIYSLSPF